MVLGRPGSPLHSDEATRRAFRWGAAGSYQGAFAEAWGGALQQVLVASANDIVEYNGYSWMVSFDSTSSEQNDQYVTNINTEIQYRWTGQAWVKSYQGLYKGGLWTLVL
jgi:hypothetical protein